MSAGRARDPLSGLYPAGVEQLPVAWSHLRVPGPPAAFDLTPAETGDGPARTRFARRTVQLLTLGPARADAGGDDRETLALIDKASPHSRFDLMVSEVSAEPRSTPAAVRPQTGRVLWRTGYGFAQFCANPQTVEELALAGGELHLALNCDPHTRDRESVQAAKQFHLHLLYWDRRALAPLAAAQPLGRPDQRRLLRQALDPFGFLGARLIAEALDGLDLGIPGACLLAPDETATLRGERPLGCTIALPGWEALAQPGFEDLVRRIHLTLEDLAAGLLAAFTGERRPPPPGHRHPLLPRPELRARIRALPWSAQSRAGLGILGEALRTLPDRTARRLAQGGPARRMDAMTLNQPAYTLNLHAPHRDRHPLARASGQAGAPLVHLILQARLFSGIGGAGLLTLGGVPSVRVLRGEGRFTPREWAERARFQRRFARFNLDRLGNEPGLAAGPIRRFAGPDRGWVGPA